MIKLICLDCDGVLVSAKQIHYESLNAALSDVSKQYVIGYEDHLENFDGRPSRTKLELLNKRGLDRALNDKIWKLKQEYTSYYIKKLIKPEDYTEQVNCIRRLRGEGYELACASNSIYQTLSLMLQCAGYFNYLHYVISNEEVQYPKPNPEIYLRIFIKFGRSPKECLIVEDSEVGLKAAFDSSAFVMRVESPDDIQYNKIKMYTNFIDNMGR